MACEISIAALEYFVNIHIYLSKTRKVSKLIFLLCFLKVKVQNMKFSLNMVLSRLIVHP